MIPQERIREWSAILQQPSLADGREPISPHTIKILKPITIKEEEWTLTTSKSSTSPGPDERTPKYLKALGPTKLSWVYNGLLLGDLPKTWAAGRTILLPKGL